MFLGLESRYTTQIYHKKGGLTMGVGRAQIDETEYKDNRKTNETMSWFFEKMSKIDKPLARLREKREDSKSEMKKEKLQLIV